MDSGCDFFWTVMRPWKARKAVFAVVSHGAKNLSEAMTIASEGLRHSPDNHASPAKNYTIWLDDNVDELFTIEYCNCSKESINTSSESSSSEEFDSDHAPPERENLTIRRSQEASSARVDIIILKYLPDLKHASGINDIWEREALMQISLVKKIVKIAYAKDNSIPRVYGFLDESYSTLGKVNLRIILNDGEKHKIIPTEFIVTGPDWPDQFPEILLGSPWMRENSITRSKMSTTDNSDIISLNLRFRNSQNRNVIFVIEVSKNDLVSVIADRVRAILAPHLPVRPHNFHLQQIYPTNKEDVCNQRI
ncbi:521_t:CDS:2 [Rhizophagus irregularis]|nr:521_t:CDS:2 [Rhizophagus irregularis]